MRIALLDYSCWNYSADSPRVMPLGGSQSAMAHLSAALANLGHDVWLATGLRDERMERGVRCRPLSAIEQAELADRDVVVVQNLAKRGLELRTRLGAGARLVFWTQHDIDQPAVAAMMRREVTAAYDAVVMVSQWQRERYLRAFALDANHAKVIRNAVAPEFERLFALDGEILAAKAIPPVLAYTSTPFRGLSRLIELFPRVRAAVPGASLEVYSSMAVYQVAGDRDEARYGELYRVCRETEGVEYIGGLPQAELAQRLKRVALLAYPNEFAETSCIAVMEALAAGCAGVTSRLGALRETCSGFATLIDLDTPREVYADRFVDAVAAALCSMRDGKAELAQAHLARQVAFARAEFSWSRRALEWTHLFESLAAGERAARLTAG